ncbi:MAG: hypothetical protein ACP5HJ_01175 [Candidatus Micrarchaeia archaeon]
MQLKEGEEITTIAKVERVFNPIEKEKENRKIKVRSVLLDVENQKIRLVAWHKLCDYIDLAGIEHGDEIRINRAIVKNNELHTKGYTVITIVKKDSKAIKDFSNLKENEVVDVIGKLFELNPLKFFEKDGKQRKMISGKLFDGKQAIRIVAWDSSAELLNLAPLSSFVKVEFAKIKKRNEALEIHANDKSRVLILRKL